MPDSADDSAADDRAKALALHRLGDLIRFHLRANTRPPGDRLPGKKPEWTEEDFAAAARVDLRTVQNWLNGKIAPQRGDIVIHAFLGSDPKLDDPVHAKYRQELRAALDEAISFRRGSKRARPQARSVQKATEAPVAASPEPMPQPHPALVDETTDPIVPQLSTIKQEVTQNAISHNAQPNELNIPHIEDYSDASNVPYPVSGPRSAVQFMRIGEAIPLLFSMLISPVAYAANILPPWPKFIILITAVAQLLIWYVMRNMPTQGERRTYYKEARWLFMVAPAVLFLLYVLIILLYTYVEPLSGYRFAKGFVCSAEAEIVFKNKCPYLGSDEIMTAEYEEERLWTANSVAIVKMIILCVWFAFCGTLTVYLQYVRFSDEK